MSCCSASMWFAQEEKYGQGVKRPRALMDRFWGSGKLFSDNARSGAPRGYGPYRGRRRWRRRRKFGKTTVVYRQPFCIPLTYCCKMQWNQSYPTTGAAHYHKYLCGNSIYRPDPVAATAQPLGFDQIMAMYDTFCVTSSKIYIQFDNNQTTPLNICLTPNTITASPATATAAFGQQFNRHMMIAGGSTNMAGMSNFMRTDRMLGKKDPQDDPTCCGTAASNATNLWYWHITATDINSVDTTGYVTVQITYWVRFTKASYVDPSAV